MARTRRLRAPFVLTTAALALGCGGETTDGGTGGNVGGTAGTGTGGTGGTGTGGTGTGGTGTGGTAGAAAAGGTGGSAGNPAACPATVPPAYTPCPAGMAVGTSCRYAVACEGGPASVTLECTGDSFSGFQVVASPCTHDADHCPGTDLMCWGGQWGIPTGTNPPPPCPATRPAALSACEFGFGGATCGYRCDDGAWSVASCALPGQWFFDGACPGDCSPYEAVISRVVQGARTCTVDADCITVEVPCSGLADHCSGVVYVNPVNLDRAALADALSSLEACVGGGCGACEAMTPPAICNANQCAPAF